MAGYSENHVKHFNIPRGKKSEFFNIKRVVDLYIVTIMRPRVKISCVGFQIIPRPVSSVPQFTLDVLVTYVVEIS